MTVLNEATTTLTLTVAADALMGTAVVVVDEVLGQNRSQPSLG